MSRVEAVLFDLDGTIIDSYPGIQRAFDNAYKKLYGTEVPISVKHLIGPPIEQILVKANGETDTNKISAFVRYFKECYDTEDYKATVLYEGIKQLLENLWERKIKMFIVTNKRRKPTQLIVQYLNIQHYFCAFYCNEAGLGYASKAEMVNHLLKVENVAPENCVLIGDTDQDEFAAKQNGIQFIYAAFGYGNLTGIKKQIFIPSDTLNFI